MINYFRHHISFLFKLSIDEVMSMHININYNYCVHHTLSWV